MPINDLPAEILREILSYLTIKEKFQCELVCHHWQKIIFTTIRSLTFEHFDNVYCGHHEHYVRKEKPLGSYRVNLNDEVMKHILSKCGRYLRSFNGFVSYGAVQIIAQQCKQLRCANILFNDVKSIQMLQDAFGAQLTCINLYTNFYPYISPFLLSCSKLTSLTVITSWFHVGDIVVSIPKRMPLFDYHSEVSAPPQYFTSLKNLEIRINVTRETLKSLALFTKLEMVSICLKDDLNQSALWRTVMASWSSLKSFSIIVYFQNSMNFEVLPPNLEFLSLERRENAVLNRKPIQFSTCLSKLKRLKISQPEMTPVHLSTLSKSISCCFPSLEELSLACWHGLDGDVDVLLDPLLSLTFLKKLTLGPEFKITDTFAAKLITDLDNLTSMGSFEDRPTWYVGNLIPGGPMFWQAVREKAMYRPADSFNFIGKMYETFHLQEPLPRNISLHLVPGAKVSVGNGFGKSAQWQELTAQWDQLRVLKLDIHDTNLFLSGMPKTIHRLTIRCLNGGAGEDGNALMFNTPLPILEELIIYQEFMTNQHLETTVKCVVRFCPKLERLCIDRENIDHESVDEYLLWMLNCKHISQLCLTNKFATSVSFGSRLIQEVKTLKEFGCDIHLQEFQCSASLLDTPGINLQKRPRRIILD